MASTLSLNAREQVEDLKLKLMEVMAYPLSVPEILKHAYRVIAQMLHADYRPIDLSTPGLRSAYDWMVVRMPDEGFVPAGEPLGEGSPNPHKASAPHVGGGDARKLSREELEHSQFFQRCRELGSAPRQGMAVMMKIDQDCHDGFILCRDGTPSFSERERELLQRVIPALASIVRRQRDGEQKTEWRWIVEEVLRKSDSESVLVVPPARELMRSEKATALLDSWFPDSRSHEHGLPQELLEHVARLGDSTAQDIREFERAAHTLRVTFLPLQGPTGRRWLLTMKEIPPLRDVPESWRARLTKREVEVVQRLLQGWENKTIADDLGCTEATVKKHLQRIYDKLGVDTRAMLQSLANRM